MSTGEQEIETPLDEATEGETPEAPRKLDLEVAIEDVGPCKKHIKVAISRTDIETEFEKSLETTTKEAVVPGFRPGHAPRQLVEKRFRKQVAEQVKAGLLMAALQQIDDDYALEPITQPELDVKAIELPDDGPLRFEMDIEVRPEFALPNYKSLTVRRPVRAVTEADVDAQYRVQLERHAQVVPKLEGGAEIGDFITADLRFHDGETTFNTVKEIQFRLQSEMEFKDAWIPDVGAILTGVRPEESREAEAKLGPRSSGRDLPVQSIKVTFDVKDLKVLRLPETTPAFFSNLGFANEQDLRAALHGALGRRFADQQREAVRREVLSALIAQVPFDLPADLVSKQEKTTIRRLVMDLKQQGLSESQIRARQSQIVSNAHQETLRSLQEFFILAKIADAEAIKVEDDDLEMEIESIAQRSEESPRRVRSRIEKEGLVDVLASQILERKTIDRILEQATIVEVPLEEVKEVETVDHSAGPATAEAPPVEEAAAP